MMRALLSVITTLANCWAEATLGTWKVNAAASTFTGDTQPKSLTLRAEAHGKGEVFTLERVEKDGRATSSSTILYFDGTPRQFQDIGCSGTQSSRRLENGAVEIMRNCQDGGWIRLVRRPVTDGQELIVDYCRAACGRPSLLAAPHSEETSPFPDHGKVGS